MTSIVSVGAAHARAFPSRSDRGRTSMSATSQPALAPPVIPAIPPDDPNVRAVRGKFVAKLARTLRAADAASDGSIDLFAVGFGLLADPVSAPRGASVSAKLVREQDWAPIGHV